MVKISSIEPTSTVEKCAKMREVWDECCWEDIESQFKVERRSESRRCAVQVKALMETDAEESWEETGAVTLAKVRIVPDDWERADRISPIEIPKNRIFPPMDFESWPNMSTVHYFIHPYFLIGILRPVALKINIIFRPFSFFGNYLCRPLI